MEELKQISKLLEKEFKNFQFDIEVDVLFSNFNSETDVQVNSLLQIKNDENYEKIVASIKNVLEKSDVVENFTILDSGFINIKLSKDFLAVCLENQKKHLLPKKQDKTIILDFGGANIGKSLHVGHIRTLNIGRSLRNIYALAGYKTITDIHFGDWGMPIALIIAYIENENIDINKITCEDLEEIYPNASILSNKDSHFYERALQISKEMNLGKSKRIDQWKIIYNLSTKNIKSLLERLDFNFDYYLGESDVISLLPDYIEKLKKKKLVKLDEGALIANDKQDPPALITKSDGSYMYLTTDIGTILYREKFFKPDYYLYVVDQRQKNHFDQLFKLVKYFKLSKSIFAHIPFGTVNGKDGKPLKTRDGKNYKLTDLYDDLVNKLKLTISDAETVSKLAKSVLTYSDLVTKRTSNYIFDIDKFVNVSGKSAIFIQYSQVRARRLLEGFDDKVELNSIQENDRALVIEILKFKHYFNIALETNEPHHIAEYAYSLCHEFNKYYKNNKIFSSDIDDSLRCHRLYIVKVFHNIITKVFECLGIEPVSEM